MIKSGGVFIMCVTALTACHPSYTNKENDRPADPVVEAMYWLEESEENVVEYLEETAAAEYVINTTDNRAEEVFELHEVDRPPLFTISCVESEAPWKCSEAQVHHYILEHAEWPYDAERNMEEGVEMVEVVIGANGMLKEIKEVTSRDRYCTGCRDAAVHVIENMPRWVPGIKNGQPVSVHITIPVRFQIVS